MIRKDINTKVSIYFLGYLFWTSVSRDLMSRDLKLVNANIPTVMNLLYTKLRNRLFVKQLDKLSFIYINTRAI